MERFPQSRQTPLIGKLGEVGHVSIITFNDVLDFLLNPCNFIVQVAYQMQLHFF